MVLGSHPCGALSPVTASSLYPTRWWPKSDKPEALNTTILGKGKLARRRTHSSWRPRLRSALAGRGGSVSGGGSVSDLHISHSCMIPRRPYLLPMSRKQRDRPSIPPPARRRYDPTRWRRSHSIVVPRMPDRALLKTVAWRSMPTSLGWQPSTVPSPSAPSMSRLDRKCRFEIPSAFSSA